MAELTVWDCTETPKRRSKLKGIDLLTKVEDFRKYLSLELKKPFIVELVHFGRKLRIGKSLEEYGIKNNSALYVFKAKTKEKNVSNDNYNEMEVEQMSTALHSALLIPQLRQHIRTMLSSNERLQNIIAATPGLADDPVAIGVLRTPLFVVQLANPENAMRVIRAHPCLLLAVNNVVAAAREEVGPIASAPSANSSPSSGTPSGRGGAAMQTITRGQLAAALASASPTSSSSSPSTSQPTPRRAAAPVTLPSTVVQEQSPISSPPVITQDMFQAALQQALQFNRSSNPPQPTATSQSTSLQSQMSQMIEMGFADEARNLRALEVSNGDVQAAIRHLLENDDV